MDNPIFGTVIFNTGWETNGTIELYDKSYSIVVTAAAYFEQDRITPEQEVAFKQFKSDKFNLLNKVECALSKFSNHISNRFIPRELLFQRDGTYALLLDDIEDAEDGIVVCFVPDIRILNQDEYL